VAKLFKVFEAPETGSPPFQLFLLFAYSTFRLKASNYRDISPQTEVRMSSETEIISLLTDSAGNRGAQTPEARRRSQANNLKHALLANTVVLDDENLQAFTDLLAAYERDLHPQSEIERSLVQNIAVSRWRLLRLRAMQRATPKTEKNKDASRSIGLMNRFEADFDRQFTRSLALLLKVQADRASK
jgi:hypothetical protein